MKEGDGVGGEEEGDGLVLVFGGLGENLVGEEVYGLFCGVGGGDLAVDAHDLIFSTDILGDGGRLEEV